MITHADFRRPGRSSQAFAAIDADKDGGLSMQELGAAMEQMQRGRSR